jgi:dienelactone hydrolase
MTGIKRIVFSVAVCGLTASVGYGGTVTRTTADGDWATASEWSSDPLLPSTGDTAVLNNNRSVTVSTAVVETPDTITVNNQNTTLTTSSTLAITETGSLASGGPIYVGANDGTGVVSIVSGGSLSAGSNMIVGHASGLQPSILEFILSDAGFENPLSVAGILYIRPNQKLVVDASAYAGADPVDLMTFSTLSGTFDTNNITIIGQEGASIAFGADSMNLKLSEYAGNRITVAALGDLTNAPAMRADDSTTTLASVSPGEMKAVYFDALDYTGSPTRVYAYVGIPSGATAASPVPGIVLVHGGGGTAFDDWVTEWTNRGYAAISIAVEGQTDSTNTPTILTGWHRHDMAGPERDGIYGDSGEALTNQWMYHAVADTVLANSLLRSLPEVDSDKVGIMGVSWGGVITATTIGIDDRFRFAVPTYGCGDLAEADNQYGLALADNDLYIEVWDPMVRIANISMPALWFSWPQDVHFPMNHFATCYTNAPGPRMVSLVPNMGHGHALAWNRPESYAFADSIISNGAPWSVQQSATLNSNAAEVVFQTLETLDSASLVSTIDVGVTGERTWTETAASLVDNGDGTCTASATLPDYTTAWFINGLNGTKIVSSDYQEVADVLEPSNVVYTVTTNWSFQTTKGNDTVTITNKATITLDQEAAVLSLTLSEGNLEMDQDFDLALNVLAIDSGAFNQSSGSVAVADVSVASGGMINLSGGLFVSSDITPTIDGDLSIQGGTYSNSIAETDPVVSGAGTLSVESGAVTITGGAATDLTRMTANVAVSGGSFEWSGQWLLDAPAEFQVIGDEAAIALNQFSGQSDGTLRFVLDATGVSPVICSSWMNLGQLSIAVDGSDYTGGAGAMTLVDSANLSVLFDTNNLTLSGFAQNGLVASVAQNQTDDWVQLVLEAHAAATNTFAASADWSSFPMFGNDDVVIDSGATVTVDAKAFADDLQLDGTLLFELGTTGIDPVTLTGALTVNGSMVVDGSAYEGLDGYFPLILSGSLSDSLTNAVMFAGFGEREPAVVVQSDGLWLRVVAPPSLSERLCSLVPDSTVAVDYSNTEFSSTRSYDPSGSAWSLSFEEAHVMDTMLAQTAATTNQSWELRTGRGGFVYSLRTPALGETVPPSWRSTQDTSPWNDEVWQGVAVDRSQNDTDNDSTYFTHQSGVYLKDPDVLTEPFYSPQVASHLNPADRSFTTVNWIPQAHINIYVDDNPLNDFKSYLLMFTRYRDLGQGVIEVSLGYYNYGPDTLDFLNMPWGGVRRTSTEYAFVSNPGGASWSAPVTNGWGDSSLLSEYNNTGGWVGFSATTNGVTPALGLVYGQDHATSLAQQYRDYSTFRCGYAGGTPTGNETDWRNYFVTSNIRWYNVTEGTGLWSRHYFVLGDDLQDLSERIADRNLVDAQMSAMNYTESETPLIAYSISGSGTSFQCLETFSAPSCNDPSFFLYAHPINNSVPIFEIIEDDESRYLTWNPYANGIVKPYDGTMAGIRLLGFAMQAAGTNGTYAALAGVLPDGNYYADGKTLFARTATALETWRVEHFGVTDDAGDGADSADPDSDALSNFGEYAFGGNPTNSADTGYQTVGESVQEGGTNFFEYVYARRTTSGNSLTYTVESTSDLVSNDWETADSIELPVTGILDPDFEAVTNRIDTTGKTNEFIRLKVEL